MNELNSPNIQHYQTEHSQLIINNNISNSYSNENNTSVRIRNPHINSSNVIEEKISVITIKNTEYNLHIRCEKSIIRLTLNQENSNIYEKELIHEEIKSEPYFKDLKTIKNIYDSLCEKVDNNALILIKDQDDNICIKIFFKN